VVVKREEMQAELAAAQKALAAAEGRVAAAGLDLAKLEERLVLTPQ
jgi:primosomal protein N''